MILNRNGAAGAVLDIYKKSISDLKEIILMITNDQMLITRDQQTEDENCKSIQTILAHIVNSGFGYAITIYRSKGHEQERPAKMLRNTIAEYIADLDAMFAFTEKVFTGINDQELEQNEPDLKMMTGWGQLYDIEQLMEHAIVHILRHERQIVRMMNNC